jgi:hypothetical protein
MYLELFIFGHIFELYLFNAGVILALGRKFTVYVLQIE